MSLQAVLFDLDGTLVDTAPDLGYALNLQRERHGLPALPQEVIRPYASHGTRGLLEVGFDLAPDDAAFGEMRDEYLALYDEVFTRSPIMFPGIPELLQAIESAGLRWGVVTNKPRRFTVPLMEALDLVNPPACVVSGDDAARPKPHPDPMFLACEIAAVAPQQCLYLGDAERDIEAGLAAGMQTVVAGYGYLDESDRPDAWGASATISHPLELLRLLKIER